MQKQSDSTHHILTFKESYTRHCTCLLTAWVLFHKTSVASASRKTYIKKMLALVLVMRKQCFETLLWKYRNYGINLTFNWVVFYFLKFHVLLPISFNFFPLNPPPPFTLSVLCFSDHTVLCRKQLPEFPWLEIHRGAAVVPLPLIPWQHYCSDILQYECSQLSTFLDTQKKNAVMGMCSGVHIYFP